MVTLSTLRKYKAEAKKFSCLTCYDAMFAKMMMAAKVDTILIGDSLGMVVQGYDSTLPVRVADIAYHTANVTRANNHAFVMADMPFMSYATLDDGIKNARELMQAGAHAVKMEGGSELCELVEVLTQAGTPVCVHLGLTPQSVNVFGGYKVQGKTDAQADQLLTDAKALEQAGASLLLLECVPAELATRVTEQVGVPVIGIGAGAGVDGQVLVMHDMLGAVQGRTPRFVHDFLTDERNESGSIEGAFRLFHEAVQQGSYPQPQHGF